MKRAMILVAMFVALGAQEASAMSKGQLKAMVAAMEARGIADSVQVSVKTVGAEVMQLNGNSFAVQGENADLTLDAGNNWAGVASEANAVFFKQD